MGGVNYGSWRWEGKAHNIGCAIRWLAVFIGCSFLPPPIWRRGPTLSHLPTGGINSLIFPNNTGEEDELIVLQNYYTRNICLEVPTHVWVRYLPLVWHIQGQTSHQGGCLTPEHLYHKYNKRFLCQRSSYLFLFFFSCDANTLTGLVLIWQLASKSANLV